VKLVVVVQARLGSTRLPGKVLLPLAGAPALQRQLERIRAARMPLELAVATTDRSEDDPIAELCTRLRTRCFRGHATDLLDRHYRAARDAGADVVVKIPSDCPLIDPDVIDRVVSAYIADPERYDYVSNLHPASYPDGNDVEVVPFPVLETAWKEAARPYEREHTTPFIWDQPDRFRIGNVVWEMQLDLSTTLRFTVDYPEDHAFVAAVYDSLWDPRRHFSLTDILLLLEDQPALMDLNSRYAGVNWYRHHLAELRTVGKRDTRVRQEGHTGSGGTVNAFPDPVLTRPRDREELEAVARRVREHIVRMATQGGCFVGSALSCTDLLVHLYSRVLRMSAPSFTDPGRDYLLLSKGHAVPALYATLAELGVIDRERLQRHLRIDDHIYWHPSRQLPGVEFHSGSLGHLLAVGVGIALDIRLRGGSGRVFVVLGDGELNEGSVWEACLVASAYRLHNLVAVVDRNGFQANAPTEVLVPLEPVGAKFEAFGWSCRPVDGHSFDALAQLFDVLPFRPGRPNAVIARTLRGKGVPSLERQPERWFAALSADEAEALVREMGEAPEPVPPAEVVLTSPLDRRSPRE
jgi:transketolase N-terminal domain/subunit/spore coat polysaccharide biosynthesis protein SpsF (cytidylyltransferase family)